MIRLYQKIRRKIRVFSIKDLFAKPIVRERWIVERSDGTAWAGPYKWNGTTFTKSPHFHYHFGSEAAARAAIIGCDLEHTIRFYGGKLTVTRIQ